MKKIIMVLVILLGIGCSIIELNDINKEDIPDRVVMETYINNHYGRIADRFEYSYNVEDSNYHDSDYIDYIVYEEDGSRWFGGIDLSYARHLYF